MVGFNLKQTVSYETLYHIYIPLWSDSIGRIRRGCLRGSVIYIPLWSDSIEHIYKGRKWQKVIYIPLWSDSIEALDVLKNSTTQIYIPLWSDSIVYRSKGIDSLPIFTFHYGRIQSLLFPLVQWFETIFTFHYGRIQSTVDAVWNVTSTHIYIPLWSDSILAYHWTPKDGTVFTFHYGRIQSSWDKAR